MKWSVNQPFFNLPFRLLGENYSWVWAENRRGLDLYFQVGWLAAEENFGRSRVVRELLNSQYFTERHLRSDLFFLRVGPLSVLRQNWVVVEDL